MRSLAFAAALLASLALAGCKQEVAEAPPAPHALTAEAIGNYCGMNVLEHPGPKGQIILASRIDPVWFSSARDAFAFSMLPEEPRDIRAIYVSDMSRAPSWDAPGATNWVEARQASFVIGSRKKGGMGADEAVPFSVRADAERFAAEHGGQVVSFEAMPRDYVLGGPETAEAAAPAVTAADQHGQARVHAH